MQTTYSQDPSVAYPGQPADNGYKDDISTIVEETNGIAPGLVVFRGTGGDRTARLPTSPAADEDAIAETVASTAGVQSLDSGDFDGVIGGGIISPAAKITFIADSSTDWDPTNVTITYEDEDGVLRSENIAIATSTTATTTGYARRVIGVSIPAQTGAGGTATIGVSADRIIGGADVLGVSVRTHKTRTTFAATDSEVYDDETAMPVRRKGRIFVAVENAFVAGSSVLVRCVAAGAEQRGAVRVDTTDGGDCVPWKHARLLTSGLAGELGELEVTAR